jgi:hypothetical protein
MIIKLKVCMSEPSKTHLAGSVVDWPDEDARRLIAADYAELVSDNKRETAALQVPEQAVQSRSVKRVKA